MRDEAPSSFGSSPRWFSRGLCIFFATLIAVMLWGHEMWRDELQAWLLARDSTWATLFANAAYEGAPPLWHIALKLLTLVGDTPALMQFLNGFFATATFAAFVYLSPFTKTQKMLLAFNYYLFYQYGVISRNYSLGLLFLTIACVMFSQRHLRPFVFAGVLSLAALTSAHALILSFAFAAVWLLGSPPDGNKRPMYLYAAAAGLSVLLMLPPSDGIYPPAYGWKTDFSWTRLLSVLTSATTSFLAAPVWDRFFWENFLIQRSPGFSVVGPALGALLLATTALILKPDRMALTYYFIGVGGLLAFFYFKFLGSSRHHGFLFFGFMYGYWIAQKSDWKRWIWGKRFLTTVLAVQASGGLVSAYFDATQPFSNGKVVAAFIAAHRPPHAFVAATPDYLGTPVAGYLNEPFYYPQGDRWGTYTVWDRRRIEIISAEECLMRITAQIQQQRRPAMILFDSVLPEHLAARFGVQLLAHRGDSLVGDENYYVYGPAQH
jgi:hypothetical protein